MNTQLYSVILSNYGCGMNGIRISSQDLMAVYKQSAIHGGTLSRLWLELGCERPWLVLVYSILYLVWRSEWTSVGKYCAMAAPAAELLCSAMSVIQDMDGVSTTIS